MLTELISLRKKVAEYEKGDSRALSLEKEKAQLLRDVEYWKDEVKKALQWQVEYHAEKKRRTELKVVFDNTYTELKQALKLVTHLRADRVGNDKVRRVLQDKVRLMEVEIDMHRRNKDFEQGLRVAADARAEEFAMKFNMERSERLQNMHRFNKEQVKVFESEKREKDATLKTMETSQAACELSRIIRQQEARLESGRQIMATQHRELAAQAAEVETLRTESANLRRVIAQKGEEVVSLTYRYLELEAELWRMQREAGPALLESRSSSDRSVLITRPSVLSSPSNNKRRGGGGNHRGWSPWALSSIIAQHRRQGMALSHALVVTASSSSTTPYSAPLPLSSPSLSSPGDSGAAWPFHPSGAKAGNINNQSSLPPSAAGPPTTAAIRRQRRQEEHQEPAHPANHQQQQSPSPLPEARRPPTTASTPPTTSSSSSSNPPLLVGLVAGDHHHHCSSSEEGGGRGTMSSNEKAGTTTLLTQGSLFVGSGMGVRKPREDYFAKHFHGSAKETLKRAMDNFNHNQQQG